MSKRTEATMTRQLKELVAQYCRVEFRQMVNAYEVTVFYWDEEGGRDTHGHFGGDTMAEALNRAHKALATPKRSKPT